MATAFDAVVNGINPTAHLKLNEASPATTFVSQFGSVTGALPGSGVTLEAAGLLHGDADKAVTLDGTNGIALSNLPTTFDGKFSFFVVFKYTGSHATLSLYSHRESSSVYVQIFSRTDDDIEARAVIDGTAFGIRRSGVTLVAGTTFRLAIVLDVAAGRREMWLDQDESGSNITSGVSTSDVAAYIGARNNNSLVWDGTIDELVVDYGVAWTAEQVKLLDNVAAGLTGQAYYKIYTRPTVNGADTLVCSVPANVLTHTLEGLAAGSVGYYWVQAVSACGVADTDPRDLRLRRVAMDGSANLIDPAANTPYNLRIEQGVGGQLTARWAYRSAGAEAAATQFFVYVATGASAISYTTPTHTVTSVAQNNSQDLGTFADALAVKCVVRAATSGGVAETNTNEAAATADATAPAAPSALTATVEAS